MTAKRYIADMFEEAIGAKIFRPEKVGIVFEEVHLRRFFAHFQIDCVFDVGANAGQYVDMLRHHVGFSGPIISFEPIPDMAEALQRNAAKDPLWYIEPVALNTTAGETAFNIMVDSQFSSLLQPRFNEYDALQNVNKVIRSISITTSTLRTEYLKYKKKLGFSRPFLKMDTQGNDMAVVQSGAEIINEFAGLQSELAIKRLYENAPHFHDAIAFYQSKGFELSAFVPNNAGHFPHLVEIDCIMFRSSMLPSQSVAKDGR